MGERLRRFLLGLDEPRPQKRGDGITDETARVDELPAGDAAPEPAEGKDGDAKS